METILEEHILHIFNICWIVALAVTAYMGHMPYRKGKRPLKRRTAVSITLLTTLFATVAMVAYVSLGLHDGVPIDWTKVLNIFGFSNSFEFMISMWLGLCAFQLVVLVWHIRKLPAQLPTEQKLSSPIHPARKDN